MGVTSMKIFRCMLLVLCLFVLLATGGRALLAADIPAAALPYAMRTANDQVTVWNASGDTGSRLATLAKGTVIYPTELQNGRYRFSFSNGQAGYIDAQYLIATTVQATVSAFPAATLWTGPGGDYEDMHRVLTKTAVTVSGVTDNWYLVNTYQGWQGYLKASSLALPEKVLPTISGGLTGDLSGKLIVVDPGHGAYSKEGSTILDSGAVGYSGALEKDITLPIAKYLQAELQNAGATVVMTRTADMYSVLTLTQRAEIANKAKADAFISVHCNAFSEASANGTETYYYAVESDAALTNNRKALATAVQNRMISATGLRNRGVKTNNFTVITKTTMPSILVETAFITNENEEKLLKTSDFQKKVAAAICAGVVEYFD